MLANSAIPGTSAIGTLAPATLQLQFDWSEQQCSPAASFEKTTEDQPAKKSFSMEGPQERKIRKMKRISVGRQPRPIPGGELWETPSTQDNLPANSTKQMTRKTESRAATPTHVAKSRPQGVSLAPQTSQRIAKPVRIGTAMLTLLRSYGISEEEIAAGIASYASANCQAIAS